MLFKYALAWFPMLVLAILNGVARDKLYGPGMKPLTAHQVSCVMGIALFTVYTAVLSRYLPLESSVQAITAGLIWLVMTVIFEFSMICLLLKRSFRSALEEYNLMAGKLWTLVLVAVALLPWAVHRLTG